MKLPRRLLVAGVLALASPIVMSTSAGASAPPTNTPESQLCTAVPADVNLVAPDGEGLATITAAGTEALDVALPAAASRAVRAADGTVWAEVSTGAETTDVYRVPVGGEPVVSGTGQFSVTSVGVVGDRPAAVLVNGDPAAVRPDNSEAFGSVIVEYADGEQVDVKSAGGPEYFVASVTIAPDRLLEGALTDLTEAFQYFGLDAEPRTDWYVPTASAPYNAAPLYQWPLAAATAGDAAAVVLSWVEGPDFDGATNELVGGWELVLANPATGDEVLRLDLGDAGATLLHADFDGRTWVGSFDLEADDEAIEAGRVVVVDTAAAEPAAVDAGCAAGVIATLDRTVAPVQPPSTTPPPPTTAAPTTAPPTTASPPTAAPTSSAPAGCTGYEPNDQYPLQLCDEGPAVRQVQQALVATGADVTVDGYFGTETEEAVRQFQQANDLEVDGLVGDDTWAALAAFAAPPGTDTDGNGIVDPGEVTTPGAGGVPSGYVGFEYLALQEDLVFRRLDGAEIPEIEYVASWDIAGDGAGLGTSGLSALWVRIAGADVLWTTTLLFDPGSEVVNDAVALELAPGHEVVRGCSVDGVPVADVEEIGDVAVFGVIDADSPETEPAASAYQVEVPTGEITELDAVRVECRRPGAPE